MAGRLEGKVAIVTGGASGLGLATVKRFLDEGAKVVMADIAAELGETEAGQLKAAGKPVTFKKLDVTSQEQWQEVVRSTVLAHGGLNVLVNSAGIAEAHGSPAPSSPGAVAIVKSRGVTLSRSPHDTGNDTGTPGLMRGLYAAMTVAPPARVGSR